MTQRYVTGLEVFDMNSGKDCTIVQMSLLTSSFPGIWPSLAPMANPYSPTCTYASSWVLVQFANSAFQLFTTSGNLINHTTSSVSAGVSLVTKKEYDAIKGAGYPVT